MTIAYLLSSKWWNSFMFIIVIILRPQKSWRQISANACVAKEKLVESCLEQKSFGGIETQDFETETESVCGFYLCMT